MSHLCQLSGDLRALIFFFVKVFSGGTVAQRVFLTNKCWYYWIVAVPEGRFMVAQGGTNGVNTSLFEFLWWHSLYVQLRFVFAVFTTLLKF